MRTVVVLASLVALAVAGTVPVSPFNTQVKTYSVEPATKVKQYKVLELFEAITQVNKNAGYYAVGKDYNIMANIANYEEHDVVEKFYKMYQQGFVPKTYLFSIFDDKMKAEAMALYDVFYYAKDFETFYKTAAWARVHVNEGLFAYTFYIALVQRPDTKDLVFPAFYEIRPEFYTNTESFTKMFYGKMRGPPFEDFEQYGIEEAGDYYFYYANYSDYHTYNHEEYKLAYFTEDIGWNTFYSYFHSIMPFWEHGDKLTYGLFKERRGEYYYYFYQQLLARYYLERLSNGLGEIPTFSWNQPFKYGYYPFMTTNYYPFVQRPNYYYMQTEKNLDDLRFVRNYEDIFMNYLEMGQFKAYNQEVDFYNSKAINFVGNFFQSNPDLYEKVGPTHYHRSYEMAARRILGAAPNSYKDYSFVPTALDFYQTSLRDPAFYQIYNKILSFIFKYKQFLQPYTQDTLHYIGVKVNNVEISKLNTFFDLHPFNASNTVIFSDSELVSPKKSFMVLQPRLNNEDFTVKINVKSDIEEQATFKVFVGPKYDGKGLPIDFEDNWMNFVQVDWFHHKLTKGENVIERSSEDFFHFKEDSLSIEEIYKLLDQNKLPLDMNESYDELPKRLMLPRGTKSGFPVQFFVFVYPTKALPKELEEFKDVLLDDRAFGYPLDRPVSPYFMQPNMYVKDAEIYHKGPEFPYSFNSVIHSNEVIKH
ncbi:arylphorin subunit alpha-like [Ostrinia nubilalis]|uniref:arylphorin subunit alpha-like n=1 Tax=Ostrinia nubilalis TaxID=29057 RepID=UPI0030822BA0